LIVSGARLKHAIPSIAWRVEPATLRVEYVFAEFIVVGAAGIAGLQTELIAPHKIVPFDNLKIGAVERLGEHDAAHRVSSQIRTVRIHLASCVAMDHIDHGLIHEPNDLEIIRSLGKLHSGDGARRNDTSSVARLCAPCDHLALYFSDCVSGFRGGPETEVIERVEQGGLTERLWALCCRIADIIPKLGAPDEANVGVDFVGDAVRIRETFLNQRDEAWTLGESKD